MRTEQEMQTMARHPSGIADGSGAVAADASAGAAYSNFFDALQEMNDIVLLYGADSEESGFARARVAVARTAAIAAWRRGKHAA